LILELTEGRKREVKHLCKAVGHPVVKLRRLEFAGITCGRLKAGQWRELTGNEIRELKKLVAL
jgi:23S rRNA pseudouridine2605 synthase